MTKKTEQDSQPKSKTVSQRARLDKRLVELSSLALSLEERAEYAEKEARQRERITEARKRITDSSPPSMFSGVLSVLCSVLPESRGTRVAVVLIGTVVLVLVLVEACG